MAYLFSSFFYLFFFGLPLAAIVFFVVSLIRYLQAKIQNKKQGAPFSVYSRDEMVKRTTLLVISIIVAVVIVAVVVGIYILLLNAIAYLGPEFT
ncbi:MAG: hypothetical protein J6S77_06080 [Clostridia bacterium]|nr:hypothetical protein [Clostridia bacterium]